MSPRRRQSNLDITSDYQIRPNEVTENDKTEGIKGEKYIKNIHTNSSHYHQISAFFNAYKRTQLQKEVLA